MVEHYLFNKKNVEQACLAADKERRILNVEVARICYKVYWFHS
jgi:hypothetical protein